MKIDLIDVDKLVPYKGNAKKHSDEQVARLANHIAKFGWDQPIVVDKDFVIIKGHGRRLAAIKQGMKKVPVLIRDDITPEEANAIRIGDNAVVSNEFDTKLLQEELRSLMATENLDFEVGDLGLSDKDQKLLLENLTLADNAALMEDTHKEIARQKEEDAVAVEKADGQSVAAAKAFGFKTVTRDQERIITRFLVEAEASTGKTGADAFVSALESSLSGV